MLSCVSLSQYRYHPFIFHPAAKEKRQHYTLGPVLAMADTPSEISSTPAGPSRPPHPPHMTGPDRTRATSGRVARMRTGPLPAHLKEKVFANMAKARTSRVATAHSTPTINIPLVATSQMNASQGWSNGSIFGASPAGLGTSDTTNTLFNTAGSVSNDYTPDGGSHTSILSEDFNIDINNSEPDPWMAVDHFTGEAIIGDHDDPVIPAPTAPQTEVETGILPRLGVHTILETAPPTLLFEDEDVRPDWLISAVRKFLRYIPYYGQLGKVVDLFLTQETRLGYPELVMYLHLPRCTLMLTMPSPFVWPFRPKTDPSKWVSSRSGHETTPAVITWTPRCLAWLSSSGGSPSSQPHRSNGPQPTTCSQTTSCLTTSIAGDPTPCF